MSWGYFLTHMVRDGRADFRASYAAGYMLRTGQPLYDPAAQLEVQNRIVSREQVALPFHHPAYEALIFVPLSFLSYVQAYWVWFALNVLMLVAIYYALRADLAPISSVVFWLPVALLAAYLPFGIALMHGQDSILFTLLLAVAFALLRREEDSLIAGVVMGLGAFRFPLLLPIIVCFLCWRRWKLIAGVLYSAIPATILSILLAGIRPYVQMLLQHSEQGTIGGALGPHDLQLISQMPNLRGLIESLGGSSWLVGIASVLVFAIAIPVGRKLNSREQLALAISVAQLVSYYGLGHDLTALFVPCAMLLAKGTGRALAVVGTIFFSQTLLTIFALPHFYLAALGGLVMFAYLAKSSFSSTTFGRQLLIQKSESPAPAH